MKDNATGVPSFPQHDLSSPILIVRNSLKEELDNCTSPNPNESFACLALFSPSERGCVVPEAYTKICSPASSLKMQETWRPCPGQSFKTFAEFQELFEDFQERSHSVWVRNSSQTVAQANEYLEKKNAELIDAALVYKNIMFTCKFGGKQRGRIGFTDDQRAQKVRCHAEILLAYNHVSKALVIRSVNLDHNHHL
ncbi:uncharacterized protein LOC117652612 [Thrips palmi]|uniref:Uncharacterized protein LOC117652612 n=1 Tax=Thrips palmi TaxID=161013 RepID=A0A6P9A6F1_THRPL|nr:uncharacterized protein LOC117652612 [Thrips palmi]